MGNRTSVIWFVDKEKIIDLINEKNSIKDILNELGLDSYSGGNYRTLKKRCLEEGIDLTDLFERSKKASGVKISTTTRTPNDKIFCKNSQYSRTEIMKSILINEFGFKNECSRCHNNGLWENEKLSLQLDHINGDHSDNQIKNLRILCPNCHSQTDTYSGKSRKSKKMTMRIGRDILSSLLKKTTIDKTANILKVSINTVKKLISKYDIKYVKKNSMFSGVPQVCHKKRFEIDKDKLVELVNSKPITEIGKMFRVSDNAIRKRCRSLGVTIPKRELGFWSKVYAGKEFV